MNTLDGDGVPMQLAEWCGRNTSAKPRCLVFFVLLNIHRTITPLVLSSFVIFLTSQSK